MEQYTQLFSNCNVYPMVFKTQPEFATFNNSKMLPVNKTTPTLTHIEPKRALSIITISSGAYSKCLTPSYVKALFRVI